MSVWIWVVVLVAAVWAAHWGAERLANPLKKLRRQWGFSAAAGGAFVGIASASPEIGINTTSALRGVSDIGLGAALGSNIIAIPLVVTVAFWASRKSKLGEKAGQPRESGSSGDGEGGPGGEAHERHRREGLLRVQRGAVTVQALPYLAILSLFAGLTLPPAWRGLQPIDGWLLLAAYAAFLVQALLRGRQQGKQTSWSAKDVGLAVAGIVVLALGAYFTVRSTENIVAALGISRIVGGLFITAPMAALPELFAVWSVTRSGQVTSATTSVIGDHAVTMTIAFLPLALTTLLIQDVRLFWVNLVFVALVPAAYAGLIHRGPSEHGFTLPEVLLLDAIPLVWIGVTLVWVLNIW